MNIKASTSDKSYVFQIHPDEEIITNSIFHSNKSSSDDHQTVEETTNDIKQNRQTSSSLKDTMLGSDKENPIDVDSYADNLTEVVDTVIDKVLTPGAWLSALLGLPVSPGGQRQLLQRGKDRPQQQPPAVVSLYK